MKRGKGQFTIEELAASQWGLFTTAQAAHCGLKRNQISRLVEKGRAEMLCYGVYRMTLGDETASAEIKAAWMSIFPKDSVADRIKKTPRDAVVAGRTAVFLHGVGNFYASPYTFIVSKRKQTTRDDMKYLLWELDGQDITFVNGLPTTTIERTIADLIRLREDPGHLTGVITDVTQKGITIDVDSLSRLLSPLAARNGYLKNDGEAFARDLLSKTSAPIQLAQISKQLQGMDKVFANSEAIKSTIESMNAITEALSKSIEASSVKGISDNLKKAQEKELGQHVSSIENYTDSVPHVDSEQIANLATRTVQVQKLTRKSIEEGRRDD